MARSGTETAVKARAAFLELIRQKERPTAAKIRAVIGGGGTDLIQRVIREMEDDLYSKTFDLANRPGIPATVVDTAERLWTAANDLADQRFDEIRAAHEAAMADLTAAHHNATAQCEQLEAQVNSLTGHLAASQGECNALRTGADLAERKIADMQATLFAKAEEVVTAKREADTRIAAIEMRTAEQTQLADARYRGLEKMLMENFDRERVQLRKDIEAASSQVTVLTNLKVAQANEITNLTSENARLTLAATQEALARATLEKEMARATRKLDSLTQKLDVTEKQLEAWKRRARYATNQKGN